MSCRGCRNRAAAFIWARLGRRTRCYNRSSSSAGLPGRPSYCGTFSGDADMPLTAAERATMIERYAHGPTLLKRALAKIPADALKWKPASGKWSAHEIVVHCADAETNAHMRLRYLIAEPDPVIVGYDQDGWALALDYHAHPLDLALATVDRKSTRLNSSHSQISYAVFCLKKKKKTYHKINARI